MNTLKRRVPALIWLLSLAIAAAALAGCAATPPTPTPVAQPEGYGIDLYVNGVKTARITLDQFKTLPKVTLAGYPAEEGPTLLSALAAAGVERFSEVTVVGLARGRRGPAERTFTREQVNNRVILDITGAGTAKLASSDLSQDAWIIDVSRINAAQGTGETPAQGYVLQVLLKGQVKATLTLDQLKALPQSSIPVQGTQQGPTLAEALKATGIVDYPRVTAVGLAPGRTGPAQRTLQKAEVTDQVVLDLTGRGTVKLVSVTFPREQWVIDVVRLEVE